MFGLGGGGGGCYLLARRERFFAFFSGLGLGVVEVFLCRFMVQMGVKMRRVITFLSASGSVFVVRSVMGFRFLSLGAGEFGLDILIRG